MGVVQPKKLIVDVATRWNSTFYMLERAILLKEALTSTLALLDSTSSLYLPTINAEDWKLCQDLCRVLKPLEEVTRQISGEHYLTGSLVIIFNRTLSNIYENRIPKDKTLHNTAIEVAKTIRAKLGKRLQDIEYNETFAVCTFLDPRFKTHLFQDNSAAEAAKKKVIDLITFEINKSAITKATTEVVSVERAELSGTEQTTTEEDFSIWDDVDSVIADVQPIQSSTAIAIAEVQRYIDDKMLPRQENPNEWWRNHRYVYPNLSKIFQLH